MSQRSKREMIAAIRPRYLKANKAGKAQILDEFVATTGCHRKSAIRVLRHASKLKGLKRPGRHKIYQDLLLPTLDGLCNLNPSGGRFKRELDSDQGQG